MSDPVLNIVVELCLLIENWWESVSCMRIFPLCMHTTFSTVWRVWGKCSLCWLFLCVKPRNSLITKHALVAKCVSHTLQHTHYLLTSSGIHSPLSPLGFCLCVFGGCHYRHVVNLYLSLFFSPSLSLFLSSSIPSFPVLSLGCFAGAWDHFANQDISSGWVNITFSLFFVSMFDQTCIDLRL